MENIFADTSDKWLISKILQSTYKTQHQKNKQLNLKMGKGHEQTLLQKAHTEDQQTYENVVDVTNHQRNAN